MKASGHFADGLMTDAWTWYRASGELLQTGSFTREKKSGIWKRYHPNGALYDEGEYADNMKIGEWRVYDARGRLSKTTHHHPVKSTEKKKHTNKTP